MPMLSAKYAAMISQSTIVSRIGPPIGGMRHDMASGAGPLTASPLPSKLLPDRRIVMDTTQKSVTLTLTERAGEEVKKFLAEEKVSKESAGLRVAVLPGGCSGFRYSLNIEAQPAADDVVIESAGVRLFVDEFSSQYLNGTVIDYKSNFQESGFAFENPNASGGCGCGSSFTV